MTSYVLLNIFTDYSGYRFNWNDCSGIDGKSSMTRE